MSPNSLGIYHLGWEPAQPKHRPPKTDQSYLQEGRCSLPCRLRPTHSDTWCPNRDCRASAVPADFLDSQKNCQELNFRSPRPLVVACLVLECGAPRGNQQPSSLKTGSSQETSSVSLCSRGQFKSSTLSREHFIGKSTSLKFLCIFLSRGETFSWSLSGFLYFFVLTWRWVEIEVQF